MIVRSILYDLVGAKVWSSVSFTSIEPEELQIQSILEFYYELVQNDLFEDGCIKKVDSNRSVSIHTVAANTLLIVVYDASELSIDEEVRISELATKRRSRIATKSGSLSF